MVEALRLVEIMFDRGIAATETRSPPPCGEGSGGGVHEHGLAVTLPTERALAL